MRGRSAHEYGHLGAQVNGLSLMRLLVGLAYNSLCKPGRSSGCGLRTARNLGPAGAVYCIAALPVRALSARHWLSLHDRTWTGHRCLASRGCTRSEWHPYLLAIEDVSDATGVCHLAPVQLDLHAGASQRLRQTHLLFELVWLVRGGGALWCLRRSAALSTLRACLQPQECNTTETE